MAVRDLTGEGEILIVFDEAIPSEADVSDFKDIAKSHLQGRPRSLAVDLAEVQLISSSLIGSFLYFEAQLRQKGFHVQLRHVGPKVQAILNAAALDFLIH